MFSGASIKTARVVRGAEPRGGARAPAGRRARARASGRRGQEREPRGRGRESATRSAARRADLHALRARHARERAASDPVIPSAVTRDL